VIKEDGAVGLSRTPHGQCASSETSETYDSIGHQSTTE
jgi:hypothetical protein